MNISISITLSGWWRRAFGNVVPEPLGPPRNVRGVADSAGVVWRWDAPTSWGPGGRRVPTAYQYRRRIGSLTRLSAWTGAAVNDSGTVTLAWTSTGAGQEGNERQQISVRSRSADGSNSAWVESAIVTEPAAAPVGRAYSSGYSSAYA